MDDGLWSKNEVNLPDGIEHTGPMDPKQDFLDEQRILASNVKQLDERTWEAESAAEALAWLRWYWYWPATVASERQTPYGTEMLLQQRSFFRGHADARWKPKPHILRFKPDEYRHRIKAARLAAAIVDVEFGMLWSADGTSDWPPLIAGLGYAAIQHYGIPTSLLDWTANPSVAVHFATCGKASKTSLKAEVLCLTSENMAAINPRIVVPPPYIRRLYLQRGVFTELTAEQAEDVERRCQKILFPAQPELPALFTDDGHTVLSFDILPEERWFDDLAKWAFSRTADDGEILESVPEAIGFTSKHGHHPALNDAGMPALFAGGDHLAVALAWVEELAGRATRTGRCFDPRILDLLEQQNSAFFEWLREAKLDFPRCY